MMDSNLAELGRYIRIRNTLSLMSVTSVTCKVLVGNDASIILRYFIYIIEGTMHEGTSPATFPIWDLSSLTTYLTSPLTYLVRRNAYATHKYNMQ